MDYHVVTKDMGRILLRLSTILVMKVCLTLPLSCNKDNNHDENVICEGEGEIINSVTMKYGRINNLSIINANIPNLHAKFFVHSHDPYSRYGASTYITVNLLCLKNLNIKNMEAGTFQVLKIVRLLDLSGNQLYRITPFIFMNQEDLEGLYLNNNSIRTLNEYSFSGLKKLKYLILSNNKIRVLSDNLFLEQNNLTELLINDNAIKVIEPYTFGNLKYLLSLNLEKNCISALPAGCFDELKSLNNLNLNFNNLTGLENNLLSNLKNLQSLHLENNGLRLTNSDCFKGLGSLNQLFISSNNIQKFSKDILLQQEHLAYINASFNPLTYISKNTFSHLKRLKNLDLSFTTPDDEGFLLDISMNNLSLHNSVLRAVDFERLKISEKVDLRHNRIKVVTNIDKLHASFVFLDFNEISELREAFRSTLAQLTISHNKLLRLEKDTFLNCPNLKWLDISYNKISLLDKDIFASLFSLKTLNLNDNSIHDLPHALFRSLKNLETLNLAKNKLLYFPTGLFDSQINLQILNVSFNRIKKINEFTLYSLKSVQVLLLDHNSIDKIDSTHLLEMKSLKFISLDGNFWYCPDLLKIIKGLERNGVQVLKGSTYLTNHMRQIACAHTVLKSMMINETLVEKQKTSSDTYYKLIDQSTEHSLLTNPTTANILLSNNKLNQIYIDLNNNITRLNQSIFSYINSWSFTLNKTLLKFFNKTYFGLMLQNKSDIKENVDPLLINKINQTLYFTLYRLNSSLLKYVDDKFTLANVPKNLSRILNSKKMSYLEDINEVNQTLYFALYNKLFSKLNSSLLQYFNKTFLTVYFNRNLSYSLDSERKWGALKQDQTSVSSKAIYNILVIILILLLAMFVFVILKTFLPYFRRYKNNYITEENNNNREHLELIEN